MRFQPPLAQYHFEKYILEIAIITLEMGGSESNPETYQIFPPVDEWKFPKYPSKTAILSPETDLVGELKTFILSNELFLQESDCCLGTWVHPQTRYFYLDIITSPQDLEEAKKMALEISSREGRKIVALYNSERNETVYL